MNHPTTEQILNKFVSRGDVYAVQNDDGTYYKVSEPVTPELIQQHLNGEVTVGTYCLNPEENTVKKTVWDVDEDDNEDPRELTRQIIDELKRNGIYPESIFLEASRYPDPSYHIVVFYDPPTPARLARMIGIRVRNALGKTPEEVEVFPKQDELTEERPLGNLVKLPFGLHREKGKWSRRLDLTTFTPINPDLDSIVPAKIVDKGSQVTSTIEKQQSWQPSLDRLRPCFRDMIILENPKALDKKGHLKHSARMALVHELLSKGFGAETIPEQFANQIDYGDGRKSRYHVKKLVEAAINEGIHPYSCNAINSNPEYQWCNAEDPDLCYLTHTGKLPPHANPESFFDTNSRGALKFVPKRLGDAIMEAHKFAATDEKSTLWVYIPEKGVWRPYGKEVVQTLTAEWLGEFFKSQYADETQKYIRYTNYIEPELFGGATNKITMANGVYNLDTGQLEPFDPENYELNSINVVYDPQAKCPRIERFLEEVLNPNDIEKIIELIGYSLYKRYPIARIFILTGTGRNGKSRTIKLIEAFLGKPNTSSLTLHEISTDRFAKAQLYGKLANLAADIPPTPIKYTGLIKTLSGEDSVSAQHKFQSRFEFTNYAKLVFSANEVPKTEDNTNAFFRRMMLITFPNEFPPDDPKTDPDILDKITTPEELSGLFNLAVKGLRNLLERGHFANEKPVEERAREWVEASNPAQHFVETYVETSDNVFDYVTKSELYSWYTKLCRAMGRRPLASNRFSMEVKRYLSYIEDGRKDVATERKTKKGRDATEQVRVWFGIRVKTGILLDRIDALTPIKEPAAQEKNEGQVYESENSQTISTISTVFNTPSSNGSIPILAEGIENRTDRTIRLENDHVSSLIAAMTAEGQVGELWPRAFLEELGLDREEAENVVRGLRESGRLIQKPSGEWRVPG